MSLNKSYEQVSLKILAYFNFNVKQTDSINKTTLDNTKHSNFPQTTKMKKLNKLKHKLSKYKAQLLNENSFKGLRSYTDTDNKNDKCQNSSCANLFEDETINSSLTNIETRIVEMSSHMPIHTHKQNEVSKALTFYLHEGLKDINSVDLVKNQYKLRILSKFLDKLSKYITYSINTNKENFSYYLKLAKILKKEGNIAAYNSSITAFSRLELTLEQIQQIKDLKAQKQGPTKIFDIDEMMIEINQNQSKKFCEIVEYFIEIQKIRVEKGDEDVENDIVSCVCEYLDNLGSTKESELSYFLF